MLSCSIYRYIAIRPVKLKATACSPNVLSVLTSSWNGGCQGENQCYYHQVTWLNTIATLSLCFWSSPLHHWDHIRQVIVNSYKMSTCANYSAKHPTARWGQSAYKHTLSSSRWIFCTPQNVTEIRTVLNKLAYWFLGLKMSHVRGWGMQYLVHSRPLSLWTQTSPLLSLLQGCFSAPVSLIH